MSRMDMIFGRDDVTDLVEIPPHVNLTKEQLLKFRPFKEWWETISQSLALQADRSHRFHAREARYSLRSITIQSVDWWGQKIGFIKMDTKFQNDAGAPPLPGTIFMRGGSVAILMIIRPHDNEDERYVIMTEQPRIPAGSLRFYEIPAGMVEEDTVTGQAMREIKEETGLSVPRHELINLTEKALQFSSNTEPHLKNAMYPSPGGCDEHVSLCLWETTKDRMEIRELQDKLTGVENEQIKVKLIKYEELWKEGARDAKTLGAWALYEALSLEGRLYSNN